MSVGGRNFGAAPLSPPPMQRRTVLGGLLLAFGCTPTGRRLADEHQPGPEAEAEPAAEPGADLIFDDPRDHAPASGHARRPLLFFVIPADAEARWRRGQVYGEYLNHGDDAGLAPLALFEVACAPMSQLRRTYPALRASGEPWLVVVDQTRANAVARAHTEAELDELARGPGSEEEIDRRITVLANLIRTAAEPAMVTRLARLEESVLPPSMKEELSVTTRDLAAARISTASAAAGILYALAFVPQGTKEDDAWYQQALQPVVNTSLAAAARDQLVRARPPKGSAWARTSGCGVHVEGASEQAAVGCGMGRVPERSRRFLEFLIAGERG